ncbi:MAG: carboxyvinyl-carboxyphosphonate phosphorylmutase [Phenylobacterium sp.]|nr:carboxyvinyl-carboxyphosphonate phosphorylmutase [Phenylobacterium sp.]
MAAGGFTPAPGACDPFTARLIERAGFPALYLGGNALGLSLGAGQPLVTLTETADCAARICGVIDLPLIVDAGSGFGAPAHVRRSVREIEFTGAAALHIDDQPFPKSPSYHRGAGGLAPVEETCAKLTVACAARRDREFLVFARTDALRVTGELDEAIARGRAYAAAGADALIVLDLDLAQARAVRAALPQTPLIWLGGVPDPAPDVRALAAAGFCLGLYPFNTMAAIAQAVSDLWRGAAETGAPAQDAAFLQRWRAELSEIAGMPAYWAIEDALSSGSSEP